VPNCCSTRDARSASQASSSVRIPTMSPGYSEIMSLAVPT
jgi:hypothetical protein